MQENLELPAAELERLHAEMVRIRSFEGRVAELFKAGAVKGTAHSYVGEEAIAVGTSAHLRGDDYVASYHRGHGHCIAKGASTDRMMAELMGRATGYCHGLGGSMHVADLRQGHPRRQWHRRRRHAALGRGGAGDPDPGRRPGGHCVLRRRRLESGHLPRVAQSGGGLAAAGAVRVREQPVRALDLVQAHHRRADRSRPAPPATASRGSPIDGNDVLAVHATVGEAIARARAGEGPIAGRGDDLALGPALDARQPARPAHRRRDDPLAGPGPDRPLSSRADRARGRR